MEDIPQYPLARHETVDLNSRLTVLQKIHPGIRGIFRNNGSMTLYHVGLIPADAMHQVMTTYPGVEITWIAFDPGESLTDTLASLTEAIELQHQ